MSTVTPRVSARTIDVGRYVLSSRHNNFVTDATVSRGGKGEAILASELYLSSLVTCGLALVTEAARAKGIEEAKFGADASYVVDPEDGTRFERVDIVFVLPEVSATDASTLIESFTSVCPIYNTVARDTQVFVSSVTEFPPSTEVA